MIEAEERTDKHRRAKEKLIKEEEERHRKRMDRLEKEFASFLETEAKAIAEAEKAIEEAKEEYAKARNKLETGIEEVRPKAEWEASDNEITADQLGMELLKDPQLAGITNAINPLQAQGIVKAMISLIRQREEQAKQEVLKLHQRPEKGTGPPLYPIRESLRTAADEGGTIAAGSGSLSSGSNGSVLGTAMPPPPLPPTQSNTKTAAWRGQGAKTANNRAAPYPETAASTTDRKKPAESAPAEEPPAKALAVDGPVVEQSP